MSLRNAKLSRLGDKLEGQDEQDRAEVKRKRKARKTRGRKVKRIRSKAKSR